MNRSVLLVTAVAAFAIPQPAGAAIIRVPKDQATISDALAAASPGDTVLVAPGRWCGAIVSTQVNLVGQGGATIIGCPGNPTIRGGPFVYRIGLALTAAATGTTIQGFTFDGANFTDVFAPEMLAIGVNARSADDVTVVENLFLGGLIGVNELANGWVISHNTFSGFTLSRSGLGGLAINASNARGTSAKKTGTRIEFNDIETRVPAGDFSDYTLIAELDLPFAGVFLQGQEGAVVSHNHVEIEPNDRGEPGAGVVATDEVTGVSDKDILVTHNDGRDCAYVVVVTGSGQNTAGATIEKNQGISLVNGVLSTFGGVGGGK